MTISEIAKLAGVSSAAVSRYFNNGYISEEKRTAIRKVVEETGYRPSVQAQTLRTKKTKMIGVIIPRIDSSAMGSVLAGVLSETNANGYHILLAVTENTPEKELEYLSVFDNKQVDAIIFVATVFTAAHRRALKKISLPLVIVGQRLDGYNCVYHDDFGAGYEMTRHVISQGKKQIGFIGVTKQDKAVGDERYRGFCDAVAESGMPDLKENYIISDFSIEDGCEKAGILLERCPDMDALVCATDKIAVGAIRCLKKQGKRIPDDIMVAGHGDSTLSIVSEPMLTTIHYYYEDSGSRAVKILLDILNKGDTAIKELKLGYDILVRTSTGGKTDE